MYTDLASVSISWRDFTTSCTSTDPVVGLALIESKKHNRWERFGCCQRSLGCNRSMNAAQTAGFYSFIWFDFWNITNQLYSGWNWPLVKYQLHVYLTIDFRSTFRPRELVKDSPIFSAISLTHQMYLEKLTEKHWPFIFFPRLFDFKYLRQSIIYSLLVMTINGLVLSSRYPGHHSSGIQQHRRGASPHNLALQIHTRASQTCYPSRLHCRFELGSW